MIWKVIGKMFVNQSFAKNKAVINGKRYKYMDEYLCRDLLYQKIYPLRDAAFGTDCSNSFQNFENHNSRSKKWVLVMI